METGGIPKIDRMSVTKYDIEAKIYPMMCVVENKINFQPDLELYDVVVPHVDDLEIIEEKKLKKIVEEKKDVEMETEEKDETMDEDEDDDDSDDDVQLPTKEDVEKMKLLTAKFTYPLHGSAKMNKFIARIIPKKDGLSEEEREEQTITIEAKIESKNEARETFDRAKKENKAAVLTTLDDAATDTFICELGAIPRDCEVTCEFSYFLELKEQLEQTARSNNAQNVKTLRLHIPMEYKVRFVPKEGQTPELNNGPSQSYPFPVSMTVEAPQGQNIFGKMVDGTERKITRSSVTSGKKWTLDEAQLAVGEDLEIYATIEMQKTKDAGEFTSAFEYYPKSQEAIFCVNVVPGESEDVDPGKKEYQLIVDRSGSMHGREIERAKEALLMLLQQLPPDDTKFNIVSFGSRYEKLWPTAKEFNEDNLAIATRYVERMDADFGGTDILEPLEAVMNEPTDCVRDVVVLTDGSVSNTKNVLKYCRSKRKTNRVWGIGIGSGCSTALVDGISAATDAESIYVKDNDRMGTKVMQLAQYTISPQLQLKGIKLPQLDGKVAIEGLGFEADTSVAVFQEKWLYYMIKNIKPKLFEKIKNMEIEVQLKMAIGNTEYKEKKYMKFSTTDTRGLYAYYADQKIKSMDNNWSNQREIIELSKKANILTEYTAFVGVSTAGNTTATDSSMGEANAVTRQHEYQVEAEKRRKQRQKDIANRPYDPTRPPEPPMAGSAYRPSATSRPPPMLSGGYQVKRQTAHYDATSGSPPDILCGGAPRMPLAGACRYVADSAPMDDDSDEDYSDEECLMDSSSVRQFNRSLMNGGGNAGLPREEVISSDKSHIVLLKLSKIKGNWEDVDDVWKCIRAYNQKLTKDAIMNNRGSINVNAFLTIVVLYVLEKYAQSVKIEWTMKATASKKFLKREGITDNQLSTIHTALNAI